MQKRLSINIEKINKVPSFIVWLLMIVVAPLGVRLFVLKAQEKKINIYNKSKNLTLFGVFVLFLIGIGIYSKIKEIIVLCDSGMSFDMISFIPDKLWLYIVGIIMCISYFMGAKKLMEQARIEQKYVKMINIKHEFSLKRISKKLSISIDEVKENILCLQKLGYLIPLEIDDKNNKIIYKKDKNKKALVDISNKCAKINKTVECSKCGAVVSLKENEYIECDFCGNGLIDESSC